MEGPHMQLEDWLDDLCVRFIINLPEEDLSSVARICFQIEEAQWFYEDFIRPLDPTLPSLSLRQFSLKIFQHCPLLASFSVENHLQAFEEFLEYKTRIPVRGAILLNREMDSTVLVKGWKKSANWSFPRGKINKDEDDLDCAIREVWEETGLDLRAADLVPTHTKPKYIEISMREQQMRLYVFRDIPMDTNFQPQTRKEISKIEWYKLSELPAFRKKGAEPDPSAGVHSPNKFYMVAPFLVPLKKWVRSQKRLDGQKAAAGPYAGGLYPQAAIDEFPTEDEAWSQGEQHFPTKAPAADALEGASHELRRLLKVQPPTQGLQSHSAQEDKGSALLSILQSNTSGYQQPTVPHANIPHTPLDHLMMNIPQPHNPHHHTNQRQPDHTPNQPPPPFSLYRDQAPPPMSQPGYVPPNRHPSMPQNPQQWQQRLRMENQPYPSPQQVRQPQHMHNGFHGNPMGASGTSSSGLTQTDGSATQMHSRLPSEHQMDVANTVQPPGPPASGRTPQLTGRSMELLNAFKRDPAAAANPPPQANAASQQTQGAPSTSAQVPALQQLMNTAKRPSFNQSPSELAGSAVPAPVPASQQKSDLLNMFKKEAQGAPPQQSQQSATRPMSDNANQLLSQFQRSSRQPEPQAATITTSPQARADIPPVDQLPVRLKPQETRAPSTDAGRYAGGTAANHAPLQTPMQPTRILQRGQPLDIAGIPLPPTAQAEAARHAAFESTKPTAVATPPNAASFPAPGSSGRGGPEATKEQKQQLLSLFAKQAAPLAVTTTATTAVGPETTSGERPPATGNMSRVGSLASGGADASRRGSQTPMSPADQSFLLGYLQSVTNQASR